MKQRRARRLARYEQIVALHQQGMSIRGIQRLTGADAKTIRKYLRSGSLPEPQKRRYRNGLRMLSDYREYLERRWSDGCHNAVQLLAELRELGYGGGYTTLRDFLQPMRVKVSPLPSLAWGMKKRSTSPRTPRRLAWLVTNRSHPGVHEEEVAFLDAIASACPEVQQGMELAQRLCTIIRERRVEELDDWLLKAEQSAVAIEMKSLARGLRADYSAVTAALCLEWSNGQVEGQVNRLKFIKRSMYGRASFDLLRARVLHKADGDKIAA